MSAKPNSEIFKRYKNNPALKILLNFTQSMKYFTLWMRCLQAASTRKQ